MWRATSDATPRRPRCWRTIPSLSARKPRVCSGPYSENHGSPPKPLPSRVRRYGGTRDRKSTRLNSSHGYISYAVFCLKKKKRTQTTRLSNPLYSFTKLQNTRIIYSSSLHYLSHILISIILYDLLTTTIIIILFFILRR